MENTRPDPALEAQPVQRKRTPESLPEFRRIGGYLLMRRLGGGGMGDVYLAYDEKHRRQVAIKVLSEDLDGQKDFVDRFHREGRSGLHLQHPNIVRSLAYGQDADSGRHYLVMEYVDGVSAQGLLDRVGRVPVGDAVHMILDIAHALEYAHSRNVIHRDIKPDNILITRSGVSKLADLGLAKRTDEVSNLTGARQVFGTTYYMPYEQALNARYADGRSDIYALGATLYHLVTGELPFPGDNHLEVVEKKNQGQFLPASAHHGDVPRSLDRILGRMLAREPDDRYQTTSELIIDLERSRLAAPVLSFVDKALAERDPQAQAYLNAGEPTRPDLSAPIRVGPAPAAPPPGAHGAHHAPAEDIWLLRYRNRAGQLCKGRATRAQVAERLRAGRLPREAEGCRRPEEGFRPLASYPEFRALLADGKPKGRQPAVRPADTEPQGDSAEPIPPPSPRRLGWLVLAVGVGLFVLTTLLLLLLRYTGQS
jgi:hypothetical protein